VSTKILKVVKQMLLRERFSSSTVTTSGQRATVAWFAEKRQRRWSSCATREYHGVVE
jgi:hypothetical protein